MRIEHFSINVGINPAPNVPREAFLDQAFSFLKDLTAFSDYMENVLDIAEEQDNRGHFYHTWQVIIEEAEFQWTQQTTVDRENRQILFDLVDGDFEYMKGAWKVTDHPERCGLELTLAFSIGLPIIEDVLGPVLKEKLRMNTQAILNSIKHRIEASHETV